MKHKKMIHWLGAIFFSAASCHANVTLPALFSDHMVLQQGMPLPVWGWADPGEKISVQLGEQKMEAVTAADGKWKAARALAYGEKIEYSGPVFESMKRSEKKVVLTFSHLGG